ncbi:hypothetical protein HTZ84_09805 [Haloterrigena sp. SYSU A558-1]|uniref:DUF3006 domain-containing protein n=1 Tax=Haloterrigena gelatinilytica TaxID=2741724 RepID=A0ABX2LDG2_9EURY|nr:hypothetical protein [Haloterrigena gelatinilytica]NUC72600.1 hypothetical protein [Haloterrigena gelatinilytica]
MKNRDIILLTPDGDQKYPNTADAAEVTEGRTQVVDLGGEGEMVDGRIFGVWKGTWKMWLDTGEGMLTVDPVEAPIMTYPSGAGDVIRFTYDGVEREQYGRLKRLKRADL